MADPQRSPELPDPRHDPAQRGPAASQALALRRPYMLQTHVDRGIEDEAGEDAVTLSDLFHIILKHKWTLLIVVLLSGALAAANTFLTRPTYRATAVLQIDRPLRVVEFNNANSIDLEQISADDQMSLRTQYELLRSRSLAERVIDELRLDQSRPAGVAVPRPMKAASDHAVDPGANVLERFTARLVSGYRKLSNPSVNDTQFLSREGVIGAFLGALTVDPVPNSRLVRLSVDNVDPLLAAKVANATAQTFIFSGQERRGESAVYAKTALEEQIRQVKARLEESERALNQFAQTRQILTLDDKTNVINQTFTDFAGALSRAEQDRIKAEALYAEAQRHPESQPLVMESKVIPAYKEQRGKLELEYQQNLRIYKPEFPRMLQLRAQIEEIDKLIRDEIRAASAAVRTQYEAAVRQEEQLRARLGQTRKQVLTTQDSNIDLNLLKREVETNRQIYDGLLQRLKQVGVTSGVSTNNVTIVDAAVPPLFPYKPNLRSNVMAGLAVGLFLGLCAVFLQEYIDDSIKSPDQVERTLGTALMGIIPLQRRKRSEAEEVAMQVHTEPRSMLAEAYRSVRTALQFSTSHGAPRRLVITSTTRDEGKSTTALALAINFAQMGQRVLLIDADMRNPSVHKLLGIPNDAGLSNLLSTDNQGENLVRPTLIPHLSVLTAGPPPPNPVDLLVGPKLMMLLDKAEEAGFAQVIVDAPPVLGIADSIVLGNQIQDMLFVVRAASTRRVHIRDALRRLRLAGLTPRGVLLTQVVTRSDMQGYGSYYGYYGPRETGEPGRARTPAA